MINKQPFGDTKIGYYLISTSRPLYSLYHPKLWAFGPPARRLSVFGPVDKITIHCLTGAEAEVVKILSLLICNSWWGTYFASKCLTRRLLFLAMRCSRSQFFPPSHSSKTDEWLRVSIEIRYLVISTRLVIGGPDSSQTRQNIDKTRTTTRWCQLLNC